MGHSWGLWIRDVNKWPMIIESVSDQISCDDICMVYIRKMKKKKRNNKDEKKMKNLLSIKTATSTKIEKYIFVVWYKYTLLRCVYTLLLGKCSGKRVSMWVIYKCLDQDRWFHVQLCIWADLTCMHVHVGGTKRVFWTDVERAKPRIIVSQLISPLDADATLFQQWFLNEVLNIVCFIWTE